MSICCSLSLSLFFLSFPLLSFVFFSIHSHTSMPTITFICTHPHRHQGVCGEVIVMLLMIGHICSSDQFILSNCCLKSQNGLCSVSPHIMSTAVAAPDVFACRCLFGSGNVCLYPSVSVLCPLSDRQVEDRPESCSCLNCKSENRKV